MHPHRWENVTGGRRALLVAGHIAAGIAFALALALVFGFVVMTLWNAILPQVLGARPVTYWQALGLLILARLLVGGFHHRPRGRGRGSRCRARMHESPDSTLDDFVQRGRTPKEV